MRCEVNKRRSLNKKIVLEAKGERNQEEMVGYVGGCLMVLKIKGNMALGRGSNIRSFDH